MSTVHIYTPQVWYGRTMRHCTTCKQRRRFVVRLYEWHPSEWICGGCGYRFTSGEGREWAGKRERLDNRWMVSCWWPVYPKLAAAVREMTSTFTEAE